MAAALGVLGPHRGRATVGVLDPGHPVPHAGPRRRPRRAGPGQRSHIIPGPNFGYWNSSISEVTSVLPRLGSSALTTALPQRQVLDALRGPVGRHLVGRHAPDLLGVGLEEDAVEAPAEAGRRPSPRSCRGPSAGGPAPRRTRRRTRGLDRRRGCASAFEALERVVVELAVVVDAAHPGPQHEVVVGQDLVPQRLDLGHLGEEAVPADVEAPAVALDGAADAADDVVGLEHGRSVHAVLGQL